MANALYPLFKQSLLNKEHDLNSDAIKATLIDSADYTYSASHSSYATDVVAGAKVAASGALTSPTIVNGAFDSADFTLSAVTGDPCEAMVLWNDTTTTPVADGLIAFYDSFSAITPNGGDINVTVNASGWFAL